MATSEKLILVGIGFILGVLLVIIAAIYHVIPNHFKIRRVWMATIVGALLGLALVITGILTK